MQRLFDGAAKVRAIARAVHEEWQHDNASLLAAAVAFYATFSVGPLLVLVLALTAAAIGAEAAQREVVDLVGRFVNPRTALAVQRLLAPKAASDGTTVTLVSAVLLLGGASAVFRQLRIALNLVLDVPTVEGPAWKVTLRRRLVAVVMVIAALALLLSAVGLTALLASVRNFVPEIPAGDVAVWRLVELLVSTAVVAGVFAAILKFVPDVKLAWRNVRVAALVAAVLFALGRYLLGIYLSRTSLTTLHGAATSLFVVLVATYFAVLVLFLAAELTEVLARHDERFVGERHRVQAEQRHVPRKTGEDPQEETG